MSAFYGIVAVLAAGWLNVASAGTERFTGKVVSVDDGDTLRVIHDGYATRIRLEGIDCPESGQAFSQRARRRTAELALRKDAEVRIQTTDAYGRLVARVLVGGLDLSLMLVREGLAWHFVQYSSDPVLASAEASARKERLGLWRDSNPVPPWEWRHSAPKSAGSSKRPSGKDLSDTEREVVEALGLLHGNTGSRVFHTPDCKNYWCARCTHTFKSAHEARAAGYRPAGCCHR